MKQKKIVKKLDFNKKSIARLNYNEMSKGKGGAERATGERSCSCSCFGGGGCH